MRNDAETRELIRRSREGDENAFGELVGRCQGYAWRLAVRLLGSEEEARDAVQESFISIWRHLDRYDDRTAFTTWLYTIVTNRCRDVLRARRRQRRYLVPDTGREAAGGPVVPASDTPPGAGGGLMHRIQDLCDRLPPRQRLVFVLRDLHELNVREVTRITGMSPGAVKTNLSHARKKLRQWLETDREAIRTNPGEKKEHVVPIL